jgi:hypothetical protein
MPVMQLMGSSSRGFLETPPSALCTNEFVDCSHQPVDKCVDFFRAMAQGAAALWACTMTALLDARSKPQCKQRVAGKRQPRKSENNALTAPKALLCIIILGN